jgi:non-specific serine/threonine protein kinase
MSVFVGGWDLAAAEHMTAGAGLPEATIDIVESLLDKSIVRRIEGTDGVGFSMLDAVQRFGLDDSAPDELESARLAHRDWYVDRLRAMEADWYGPNQVAWLAFARRQLPNLRAAVDFSVQRGDAAVAAVLLVTAWRVVWQAQGRFEELRRRGLEVLALGEIDTPELCQLLVVVGGIECAQGDPASGFARLDEAAVIASRLGDPFTISSVPGMHGSVDADIESCIAAFESSLAIQGGRNLFVARANVEERLALAYDRGGRREQAADLRAALVRRAVEAGDVFETSYLLLNAGLNAGVRGEASDARELLRQALSLKQGMDDPVGLAQAEEALASVAALEGDGARAATLLGAARSIWDEVGGTVSTFPSPVTALRPGTEEAARSRLGARGYDSAFDRGRAYSVAQGIAFALGADLPARAGGGEAATTVLTARERQVAALVGQGLTDRAIAERLVISRRTAEGHVSRSLMKLGFTSRAQLASWSALSDEQA